MSLFDELELWITLSDECWMQTRFCVFWCDSAGPGPTVFIEQDTRSHVCWSDPVAFILRSVISRSKTSFLSTCPMIRRLVSCCYSASVGERSIAISLSVCLFASISVEPLDRSSRNFVHRSTVAVARSSSGGDAICYVLRVLWMTSRLAVMGCMAMRG